MLRIFEGSRFNKQAALLVLLCVFYNPLLAIINGNVFSISRSIAVVTEIVLLCSLFAVIVHQGFKRSDAFPMVLLIVFVVTSQLSTVINGFFFVDAIRNVLIISIFTMAGMRLPENIVHGIFFVIATCVLFALLVEIISIKTYVNIFQPALYYANTRGREISEFNELGIFNAALSFSGRFTFGVFSGPRTSSLFLEQVSLGNYASILSFYLMVFWEDFSKNKKCFLVGVVVLIVLSTVSRTGAALSVLMLLGYRIFPKLPKYTFLAIVPTIILFSALVLILRTGSYEDYGDNLIGRIVLGMGHLFSLEFGDYFGFGVAKLGQLWDSGFAYLVASSTVFGALMLWFFISFFIPQNSERARRCVWGINVYFFLTIVVSGNSVYSIKTAALVWLIFGFIYMSEHSLANSIHSQTPRNHVKGNF